MPLHHTPPYDTHFFLGTFNDTDWYIVLHNGHQYMSCCVPGGITHTYDIPKLRKSAPSSIDYWRWTKPLAAAEKYLPLI